MVDLRSANAITKPLGFFVLALLIVESFLCLVLIYSDLSLDNKFLGVLIGCSLFVIVVIIVGFLVWSKPTHLLYGEEAHLKHEKMFGTQEKPMTQEEISMQPIESKGSKKGRRGG